MLTHSRTTKGVYCFTTNHRITDRTKYFMCKWHWFWEHVGNKAFDILKCPTDKQHANYLTKTLPKVTFKANHEAVQGW